MDASRGRWLSAALLITATGCIAVAAHAWRAPASMVQVPGMVRQTEIRIAAESTGRLASLAAVPGQHVRRGDALAILHNPELAASVGEAKAAAASAKAERDRVYSGIRAEEVGIAAQNVRTAKVNLVLAQKQNARAVTLSSKNVSSRQQLDDRTASLAKAQADLDLKRAQYAAAKAGPSVEERALADAKLALAEATVADLEARFDKTILIAPVEGIIGIQVSELGEIITPGKPIMTMEVDAERWFTFTLREDRLQGVTVGNMLALTTGDGGRIEARVTEVRPLGEFATWRAARAVGDHDLNSFRLRLDPVAAHDALQPGMTVWLSGAS